MNKLLLLGLAGGMGTLARYGLGGWVHRMSGADFPWGTVAVNICGCFLAGLLWSVLESREIFEHGRLILFVGFLGGFTTFSAFALESSHLIQQSEWLKAAGNIAIQNGVGIVACFVGMGLGKTI